jgi:hypothetical protein
MGETKMPIYHIIDFLKEQNIRIHPAVQRRAVYPFTMQQATSFFSYFEAESFRFFGTVRSILVYDGRAELPDHSYVVGYLFPQTAEELDALPTFPNPVGMIYLEYGGTRSFPYINVKKLGIKQSSNQAIR